MADFNLSNKRFKVEVPGVGWIWVIAEEDNKEFIRLLKKEIEVNYFDERPYFQQVKIIIDKLVGWELND